MLMNKTTIECWNILRYEMESIIDQFVPFKKQGRKAIRKIAYKETMYWVYRRTRKETTQITKKHLMQLRLKLDIRKKL